MAAVQLSFTLRTSPNCKTVHLVGNWDGYKGQLPLSKDSSSSRPGAWKGTFRFQGSTLKQGQRYWYYYIIDGYHVSHDPALPSVTEPTTGRQLNTLDVPTSSSKSAPTTTTTSSRTRRSGTTSDKEKAIPKGRPISPSRIISPRPVHPPTTKLTSPDYARHPDLASLSRKLAAARIDSPPSSFSSSSEDESDSGSEFEEDSDSDVPSLGSSRTSDCSSPRSLSGGSSSGRSERSSCSCERFGITRKGDRVRLDCGGARCGYSDGESSCSSSDGEGERERYRVAETRRQGVVVRGSRR